MTGNETEQAALARFEALLDAYGAAPKRWPADRRAWAEALLVQSRAAQELHREAARLDVLLDAAAPSPAPAHLVGRVLAAAPGAATSRPTARGRWLAAFLRPAAGLAFAALLGIALGVVVSPFEAVNGVDLADAEAINLAIGDFAEVDL